MRVTAALALLWLAVAPPVSADGLVSEPQALVYYQVPFSGAGPDTRSSFGVRLDRTVHEVGQVVEFSALMPRPAVMDVRFAGTDLESVKFGNVDYLARYRALRADEEQKPSGEAAKGGSKDKPAEEKRTMSGLLDKAPLGYIIGAGIGVLLVVGPD